MCDMYVWCAIGNTKKKKREAAQNLNQMTLIKFIFIPTEMLHSKDVFNFTIWTCKKHLKNDLINKFVFLLPW